VEEWFIIVTEAAWLKASHAAFLLQSSANLSAHHKVSALSWGIALNRCMMEFRNLQELAADRQQPGLRRGRFKLWAIAAQGNRPSATMW
jgi:hypothetical protein